MMLERFYRILVQPSGRGDYNPIDSELIIRLLDIEVDQTIDLAWEARVRIRISTDEAGKWSDKHVELVKPFSRFRIEVKVGEAPFLPLIDGPVVSSNVSMSSDPGESTVTIVIHDDSIYLNQDEEVVIHEGMTASQIAQQCFGNLSDRIVSTCIEQSVNPAPAATTQRGSPMQLLVDLAKKNGMHIFVLPGPFPGQSIGCFQSLPTRGGKAKTSCSFYTPPNSADFAPLVLMGPGSNLRTFDAINNGQAPAQIEAASLDIVSKVPVPKTADPSTIGLVSDAFGRGRRSKIPRRLLRASGIGQLQESDTVSAEAERLSYAIVVTGSVYTDLYPNILQPYRMVNVTGVSPDYCGEYLITQVTHKITHSNYTQSFTLKGVASTDT